LTNEIDRFKSDLADVRDLGDRIGYRELMFMAASLWQMKSAEYSRTGFPPFIPVPSESAKISAGRAYAEYHRKVREALSDACNLESRACHDINEIEYASPVTEKDYTDFIAEIEQTVNLLLQKLEDTCHSSGPTSARLDMLTELSSEFQALSWRVNGVYFRMIPGKTRDRLGNLRDQCTVLQDKCIIDRKRIAENTL
jgi:hypothetical protein